MKFHSHKSHKHFCAMSKTEREANYEHTVQENFALVKSLYENPDDWKLEHGKNLDDGILYSQHVKHFGKVYKLDGILNTKPEYVFCQIVHLCADTPSWNPTVQECKVLDVIDSDTDIVYNVSTAAAGGLVSSREFIDVRKNFKDGDMIYSIGAPTFHPDAPESHKYVRGENNISSLIFKDVNGKCLFTMIMKIDLKGWLPHRLIDQAMVGTFTTYFSNLRQRMEDVTDMIQEHFCCPSRSSHDQLVPHDSVHQLLSALHVEHTSQSKDKVTPKHKKSHFKLFHALKQNGHHHHHSIFHHNHVYKTKGEAGISPPVSPQPTSENASVQNSSMHEDVMSKSEEIASTSFSQSKLKSKSDAHLHAEESAESNSSSNTESGTSKENKENQTDNKSMFWKRMNFGYAFKKHKEEKDVTHNEPSTSRKNEDIFKRTLNDTTNTVNGHRDDSSQGQSQNLDDDAGRANNPRDSGHLKRYRFNCKNIRNASSRLNEQTIDRCQYQTL